jgi:hypothetical protein
MHEPHCEASFGFIDPVVQYDHDQGRAITRGFVYRGSEVPELDGRYLFGAIVNGRIFHADARDPERGRDTEIEELTLLRDGEPVTLLDPAPAPRWPPARSCGSCRPAWW